MNTQEIIKYVDNVVDNANKKFVGLNLSYPSIEFFTQTGYAGWANPKRNLLKFNLTLAAANADKFHETIIHEVSHLVTCKVYPCAKQAHGPEFKKVDLILGGRGTRLHSYDTTDVKRQFTKYEAVCTCKTHLIGPKFKKYADLGGKLQCKLCNTPVKFTGNAFKGKKQVA